MSIEGKYPSVNAHILALKKRRDLISAIALGMSGYKILLWTITSMLP